MLNNTAVHSGTFIGATSSTGHEYYHLGRVRTHTADVILGMFATAASTLVLARGVKRDELFDKYDVKLWSYNDNLALFALTTLPAVVGMAATFAASRGIEGLRSAFSL